MQISTPKAFLIMFFCNWYFNKHKYQWILSTIFPLYIKISALLLKIKINWSLAKYCTLSSVYYKSIFLTNSAYKSVLEKPFTVIDGCLNFSYPSIYTILLIVIYYYIHKPYISFRENLDRDKYLKTQMDGDHYVPISTIAGMLFINNVIVVVAQFYTAFFGLYFSW